jgi:hypothetical protein
MPYFYTENANRTIRAGNYKFEFEPVSQTGGCWDGVLKTEDEHPDQANALRSCPSVKEITAAEYDDLLKKKQVTQSLNGSQVLAVPDPSRPLQRNANPAVNPSTPPPPTPKETLAQITMPTMVDPPREVVSHRTKKEA